MAKYPIVRSQRTLPIPNLERGALDFDTGEAEVWENIGRLAGVASQTLIGIHLKQADNQFMNASLDAKAKWDELADELSTNLDENTFMAAYEKKLEEIKKLRPRNETAGRMFDASIKNQAIDQKKATRDAMKLRVNDTWQVTRDRLTEDAVRTGSMALLTGHMLAGTEAGLTKRSTAMNHLRDTAHKASRRSAENMALSSPEAFLKKVQGNKIEGMPLLTPGDVQDLRNTALGEISFRKQQEDAALSAFYDDVSKKAEEGMAFAEMREIVQAQPGLTVKERQKAMILFRSASRTWDEGGTKENPWKTTQDYNALMEMQIKISRGEPVTEMDIWRAQAAQPEKGPLFSRTDGLNLISQLPDNKDVTMKTPFATEWMLHVDEMFLENKIIPREDIAEWSQTRQGVERIIKENYPNVGKAQKEIEEFLEPQKRGKAKEILKRTLGSPVLMALDIGKAILKDRPIHVESLEDAQKLKQGTSFEYQGRVYMRK